MMFIKVEDSYIWCIIYFVFNKEILLNWEVIEYLKEGCRWVREILLNWFWIWRKYY